MAKLKADRVCQGLLVQVDTTSAVDLHQEEEQGVSKKCVCGTGGSSGAGTKGTAQRGKQATGSVAASEEPYEW